MLVCKSCEQVFDPVERVPHILKCGHTFCLVCIELELSENNEFHCLNCFYICPNLKETIINKILTDKGEYVQDISHSHIRQLSKAKRFEVEKPIEEQPEFLEISQGFDLIREQLRSSKMPVIQRQKCKNQNCNKVCTGKFCSVFCHEKQYCKQDSFSLQKENRSENLSPH